MTRPIHRLYGNNWFMSSLPVEVCSSPALVREYTNRGYRYQTTCSTHTPANKAALKALAIAEGGTTVVPEIFSDECYGGMVVFIGLHELTSFGLGTFAVKSKMRVSKYGSWRHKLKAGVSMFRQAQHDKAGSQVV